MKFCNLTVREACCLLLMLLFVAGHSQQAQGSEAGVKFGLMDLKEDGNWVITQQTLVIPYGKKFGYVLPLGDERPHKVYDILYMPARPNMLSGLLSDKDPEEATTGAKTQTQQFKGSASSIYWFDPGDPVGQYRIEVYVDGTKRHSFEFEIVK